MDISQQQTNALTQALADRSSKCDRRILATREDGQAGLVLVGPDSILLAQMFFGGMLILDAWMN